MDIISPETEWTVGLLTTAPIELKLLDNGADQGLLEGYGAGFGGTDYGGDTIAPGAFSESLAQHRSASTAPAMLWSHRQAEPIGRWTAMGEDAHGLRVRGQLNRDTPAGRKALAHLKAGDVQGLSIGYQVPPGGSKVTSDGKRTLTKVHLHEVSVVAVPMNPIARVTSVKSLTSRAELEDLLRESGLPRPAARKLAAGGWPALAGGDDDEEHQRSLAMIVKALDKNLLQLKGLKL